MAKINKLLVGESLVGEGNEVAHIDLIIGPRGSAAETAFANALTNNKDGFTTLLAVVAPNLLVKPATVLFNKVTIKGAKQAVQMFGPAQHAVAKAVADSVADGIIPVAEADDLFISVGVFIHWEAKDDKKIQDYQLSGHQGSRSRAPSPASRRRRTSSPSAIPRSTPSRRNKRLATEIQKGGFGPLFILRFRAAAASMSASVSRPSCSAEATSAPLTPARASAREIIRPADAAGGVNLAASVRAADRGEALEIRPRVGADPGESHDDRPAPARAGGAARMAGSPRKRSPRKSSERDARVLRRAAPREAPASFKVSLPRTSMSPRMAAQP